MLELSDINVLLEALDAWEKEPETSSFGGDVMMTLLSVMAGPKKEVDPEGYERHRLEQDRERKQARDKTLAKVQLRKDTVILLKAKLIQMRNELMAAHS